MPGLVGVEAAELRGRLFEHAATSTRGDLVLVAIGPHGLGLPAAGALAGIDAAVAAVAACGRLSDTRIEKSKTRRCAAFVALISTSSGFSSQWRVVERVAQQLRHPLVGLRDAGEGHDLAVLAH